MKVKTIIILIFISLQLSLAQNVDFRLINYEGLEFYSSKSEITKKLGNPIKTFEPKYECGFLSEDEQGVKYISLDYGKVKFTGNEKEEYLIEMIDFENDNSLILKYGKHNLTCETKLTDLALIFGEQLIKHYGSDQNGGIVLFDEKADDGIRIEIKDGKLVRFGYWSPC
ncbi:hypothetical protein [uncultured Aquimarina sp.]|uniref:hypothetical protein n=1 Tax=uncultured Aquimarina sp. TaxID=575652 RepID=UPI0026238C58|nr:hypothetical protein [uncultured Aquimarina sp.]